MHNHLHRIQENFTKININLTSNINKNLTIKLKTKNNLQKPENQTNSFTLKSSLTQQDLRTIHVSWPIFSSCRGNPREPLRTHTHTLTRTYRTEDKGRGKTAFSSQREILEEAHPSTRAFHISRSKSTMGFEGGQRMRAISVYSGRLAIYNRAK